MIFGEAVAPPRAAFPLALPRGWPRGRVLTVVQMTQIKIMGVSISRLGVMHYRYRSFNPKPSAVERWHRGGKPLWFFEVARAFSRFSESEGDSQGA